MSQSQKNEKRSDSPSFFMALKNTIAWNKNLNPQIPSTQRQSKLINAIAINGYKRKWDAIYVPKKNLSFLL